MFSGTAVLSFVLGLELHSYRRAQDEGIGFGTTCTLTLIGAGGFLLWLLDGAAPRGLYLAGLAALAVWLAVNLAKQGGDARAVHGDGGALLPSVIASGSNNLLKAGYALTYAQLDPAAVPSRD